MPMKRVFQSDALHKVYGKRRVVNGVSIEVGTGEVVGLLGPNGAGKTTTFYMMTGMIRPSEGRILLDGQDVTGLPMFRRARRGVGYLPQEASIFRKLTVEQNLMAILETLPLNRGQRRERLEMLLTDLRVSHLKKAKAYTLSGGERRRVEIARALVTQPAFILLDEPFAGVDPIAVGDIQSIVHDLRSRNIGVLITDHNVHETLSITDRAYLLYEGRILKSGSAEELAEDEQVRRLYLGENFRLVRRHPGAPAGGSADTPPGPLPTPADTDLDPTNPRNTAR
jgi:lipopolysaccharide export system ATP-binding protein